MSEGVESFVYCEINDITDWSDVKLAGETLESAHTRGDEGLVITCVIGWKFVFRFLWTTIAWGVVCLDVAGDVVGNVVFIGDDCCAVGVKFIWWTDGDGFE